MKNDLCQEYFIHKQWIPSYQKINQPKLKIKIAIQPHSSLITHHSSLITHHSSLITYHSSLITLVKFLKFLSNEALNLAIGYLAGLSASMLVSRFFVKRGIANLWGLTAKKEAIHKGDYETLMFAASYFIGLVVMVSVNYGMKRWRGQPVLKT